MDSLFGYVLKPEIDEIVERGKQDTLNTVAERLIGACADGHLIEYNFPNS